MSLIGTKRTSEADGSMSAIGGKADINGRQSGSGPYHLSKSRGAGGNFRSSSPIDVPILYSAAI
jgi:hypothetical protein